MYHDRGLYFQIKGVSDYWNMGVYQKNTLHLKNVIRQSGSDGECLKMRYLLKHKRYNELFFGIGYVSCYRREGDVPDCLASQACVLCSNVF